MGRWIPAGSAGLGNDTRAAALCSTPTRDWLLQQEFRREWLSNSVALRTIAASQLATPDRAPRRSTNLMIEQQPTVDTTVLSLSDAAALKLRELTKEESNPNIGLRVYVYSGGCSGFRYGMMLEDQPTPEDNILEVNGTKVYVDGNSIPLLKGSEIDYVDTLMGAGFTVNNPNAVTACGCGSSFRTADDAGTARSCAH
jgi:iron-sulfur cluster assembly accessory protein